MMRKTTATLASLLLVFGLGGCLLSLTESFEYDVLKENDLLFIDLEGKDGHIEAIDLADDPTFEDNQDKIKTVDRVTFHCVLFTKNDSPATVDIYFRGPDTTAWTLLLEGVNVSAASTANKPDKIKYADSEDLIRNFTPFQKLAEKGIMDLKIEAREGNDAVQIDKLILYVAITAGK
jgi:hypothetical protein